MPIGVWLTMALVALVHNEFDRLKCLSHSLSFTADGSIGFELSSRSSKKFLLLESDVWKSIFH